MKLLPHYVEKPWGCATLPAPFASDGRRIGEIWFEAPDQFLPLMIKYIFTSEKLSIQVHPSDEDAAKRGLSSGKEECWYVLDAAPDAVLGIGTRAPFTNEALRDAAVSGALEALIDWKPVKPGDFFYIPSGTVHAIGAGITLIEIQQNADITYRLFDYGRPRALHLDEGVAVARAAPYSDTLHRSLSINEDIALVSGPKFSLRLCGKQVPDLAGTGPYFITPLKGQLAAHGDIAAAGDCIIVDETADCSASDDARLLVARACG